MNLKTTSQALFVISALAWVGCDRDGDTDSSAVMTGAGKLDQQRMAECLDRGIDCPPNVQADQYYQCMETVEKDFNACDPCSGAESSCERTYNLSAFGCGNQAIDLNDGSTWDSYVDYFQHNVRKDEKRPDCPVHPGGGGTGGQENGGKGGGSGGGGGKTGGGSKGGGGKGGGGGHNGKGPGDSGGKK